MINAEILVGHDWLTANSGSTTETNVVANLGQEELRLVQVAGDIFQRPSRIPITPFTIPDTDRMIKEAVEREGVHGIERAFKLFRWAVGEEEYGGLDLAASESDKRTPLDEYFPLIHGRQLVINKWSGDHDVTDHLMGGLLMSSEIALLLSAGAQLVQKAGLGEKDREAAGNAIDFAISYVQKIWKYSPEETDYQIGYLAGRLINLYNLVGMRGYEVELRQAAQNQGTLLSAWKRGDHFPTPTE